MMRCVTRGFAFAFVGLILMTVGFCLAMAGWFTPPVTVGVLPIRVAGTIAFFAGLAVLLGSCFACAIQQRRCCRRCLSSASINTRPIATGRRKTESRERNGRMQEAEGQAELPAGSEMRNARPGKQQQYQTSRVGRAERVVQVERYSDGSGREGATNSEELSPSDSTMRRREPERLSELSRVRDNRVERVPATHVPKISHARRSPDSKQRPRSVGGTRTEGVCVTSAPLEYLYISPGLTEAELNSNFRYVGRGNLQRVTDLREVTPELSSSLGELTFKKHVSGQVRERDLELATLNFLSGSGSQLRQGQDQGHGWTKAQFYDTTDRGLEVGRSIFEKPSDQNEVLKRGHGHVPDTTGQDHTQKWPEKTGLRDQGHFSRLGLETGRKGHMLTLAQEPRDENEMQKSVKRCRSCEEKYLMRIVRNDENETPLPVSTGSRRRGINEATQTPLLGSSRLRGAVRVGDRGLEIGINNVRDGKRDLEGMERRQGGSDTVGERNLSGIGSPEGCKEGAGVKYRRVLCPVHDLPKNWRMSNT